MVATINLNQIKSYINLNKISKHIVKDSNKLQITILKNWFKQLKIYSIQQGKLSMKSIKKQN